MNRLLFIIVFVVLCYQPVFSQPVIHSFVSSQFFRVNDLGKSREDYRDLMKDIQELMPLFAGKQPIFNHLFVGDSASPRLALDEFGQISLQTDSTSFVVLHFFSTWFKRRDEWNSEVSKGEVISLKYLEYFSEFIKPESGLIVLLSPANEGLLQDKMSESEFNLNGGKQLMIISYPADMSYFDAMKQYIKALRSCTKDDEADLNKDRVITFSERLLSLKKYLNERELSAVFYQLYPGTNPVIGVLDK